MPHAFRFGVIAERTSTADSLLSTAARAESLGYSTFLLRDHFVTEPFGDQLAPLIALTAVAASTDRLRLGTLVLANDYRHPVMLAKETATLDALSGGRFELGLGAGWLRDEYERAGIPFDAPGVRVDRLAESLQVLRKLLSGETVRYRGGHYSIDALSTVPRPSRPPQFVVGAGSPRMLRLAGELADTVGVLARALPEGTISTELSERTPQTMDRKVALIAEAGRDVELSMVISPMLEADRCTAADRFASERGWGSLDADTLLEMPSVFIGSTSRIAETMRSRRERWGFSYYVVSNEMMDAFAPVVGELNGT